MKRLNDILKSISPVSITGDISIEISKIEFDSRKVQKGDLFVAVNGTLSDGHNYINQATNKGAIAIICEKLPDNINSKVTYVKVKDSGLALGLTASEYFNNPSQKIKVIGITGTNGKTTTATLLHSLFTGLGYKAGLLSTIANFIGNKKIAASHTTPDAVTINNLFNLMIEEGCEYCFMEVSSHAIDQQRIAGIEFKGGLFSNITHDHLDYHKTFKEYLNVKKHFFDNLPASAFALSNKDDKNGKVMLQNTLAQKKYYALKSIADYKCRVIETHFDSMLLNIDGDEVWTSFIGKFNASNILAVYAIARELNIDKNEILTVISKLKPVQGRFETIKSSNGILAIVDYAHTPDALKNVLNTINELRTGNEQVITVVGAGGDRDKSKRPEMAQIASALSNKIILTSDNPRSEDPNQIIAEMAEGISAENKRKLLSIVNRREAIRTACMLAQRGDIILIAGKGHETYQEINGIRSHFDDREELKNQFLQIINLN